MNDYQTYEKTIVRELSCRLCLCTDVVKLKPLSAEVKRKIKRLFDIIIKSDDNLPKAICHECLQQLSTLHLYSIKVEKTQKFLEFHQMKTLEDKRDPIERLHTMSPLTVPESDKTKIINDNQQGDSKINKLSTGKLVKKRTASDLRFMESMTLEEFASSEKVDMQLLSTTVSVIGPDAAPKKPKSPRAKDVIDYSNETLDPLVITEGKPAKQGAALDRQITLFYKMECCICHQNGFHFRSLMKHYKDRHGVPGYVTCCDKKFHYFYPKKIIEHMAYHLQPNIFRCPSCHHNFQTSQALYEHQSNGGRSEGKIICPRCSQKYPTYHELGCHLITHRSDRLQCDHCGKLLKHHRRKKTINHMEDVILCSQCIKALRAIEKQEKEIKEKIKAKSSDTVMVNKHEKFKQAMGLSGDEDASTD